MTRRILISLTPVVSIFLSSGCGSSTETAGPDRYPATGFLKFQGKPASGAMLRFIPVRRGGGIASTDGISGLAAIAAADGSFTVMSGDGKEGAPEGEYKLLVLWLDEPPGGGLPVDRLRGKYFDEAKPVALLVVKPESNDWGNIELSK